MKLAIYISQKLDYEYTHMGEIVKMKRGHTNIYSIIVHITSKKMLENHREMQQIDLGNAWSTELQTSILLGISMHL